MTLYFIGLGLNDEKDITLHGLEAIKKCKKLYLETYTSMLQCPISHLQKLYRKKIILADRDLVEQNAEETILADAKNGNVGFLVVGDPVAATTHTDLLLRAREKGIDVRIINNASIMNAIGNTGLELYKFGRTTSLVFPRENWMPESPYDAIKKNKQFGLHTLCLLDIQIETIKTNKSNKRKKEIIGRYMTVNDGLRYLLDIEKKRKEGLITEDTLAVGCARLGAENNVIKTGKVRDLLQANFGKPLHCLIIPGELHFKEEEMLRLFMKRA